jgi:hypothetical protein
MPTHIRVYGWKENIAADQQAWLEDLSLREPKNLLSNGETVNTKRKQATLKAKSSPCGFALSWHSKGSA